MKNYIFLFFFIVQASCNGTPNDTQQTLNESGSNRSELEKVIDHYKSTGDKQKLAAVYFLIDNMRYNAFEKADFFEKFDDVFSFSGYVFSDSTHWESEKSIYLKTDSVNNEINLNSKKVFFDINTIQASVLIANIDSAFAAWKYPWAMHLDFDEFCEYLLPYKIANEKPLDWHKIVSKEFYFLKDSLKNITRTKEACSKVNNFLKGYFHVNDRFNYPGEISLLNLIKGRIGRCFDATNLTVYTMRTFGIPVVVDFTPHWANRSLGHSWNSVLYENGKFVRFMGAGANPGFHKVEYSDIQNMHIHCAKIFRRMYSIQKKSLGAIPHDEEIPGLFSNPYNKDVTAEYMPVTNIIVKIKSTEENFEYGYLCVFDNKHWQPIHWGKLENNNISFSDMGRNVVYLPVCYKNKQYIPFNDPIYLSKDGSIKFLEPDTTHLLSAKLLKKYPIDETNSIKPGDNYELYYWNTKWISLGKQKALDRYLVYSNIPSNALLLLHDLDRGRQERIFTLDNKLAQTWW